jgi:uncharacterized protein (TIGR02118 family)
VLARRAMITVSVLYPATEGASFDHDYYRDKHIPLIEERLGDALKGVRIEKGVGNGMGGDPPFVAGVHMLFDSMDAFGSAMAPHGAELAGDMQNYTTVSPVMQVSEVVSDR